MTGSVAIDVAIGLIFIFLLYSLLASVILEIISTNLGIRAANLKRAIYRMLNDDNEEDGLVKKGWLSVWSLFGRGTSQKRRGLARAFYQTSAIKYLGTKGVSKSAPSGISAQQFSKGILNVLTGEQSDSRDQAGSVLAYFKEPTKRKETDAAGKDQDISDAEFSGDAINYLKFLFNQSQGDLDKFTVRIEEWYEEMMLVATEWYKKRTQILLFLIGMLLAVAFNINTLQIIKILSNDNTARDQLYQLAASYAENQNIKDIDALTEEQLNEYLEDLKGQSSKATQILGVSKTLPDSIYVESKNLRPSVFEKRRNEITTYLRKENGNYTVFRQPIELKYLNLSSYLKYENCTVIGEVSGLPFDKSGFFWQYQLWGYVLTALAISLGAPFWFDLLNRVMQLRGAMSQKKATSQTASSQSSETKRITKG